MAPFMCWSFNSSMFRYRFVDHVVGLSFSIDQYGVSKDRNYDVRCWEQKIKAGISPKQADLLNLSFLNRGTTSDPGRKKNEHPGGFHEALNRGAAPVG